MSTQEKEKFNDLKRYKARKRFCIEDPLDTFSKDPKVLKNVEKVLNNIEFSNKLNTIAYDYSISPIIEERVDYWLQVLSAPEFNITVKNINKRYLYAGAKNIYYKVVLIGEEEDRKFWLTTFSKILNFISTEAGLKACYQA